MQTILAEPFGRYSACCLLILAVVDGGVAWSQQTPTQPSPPADLNERVGIEHGSLAPVIDANEYRICDFGECDSFPSCDEKPSDSKFLSGYKNGFFFATEDDAFRLKIRGLLQTRHYASFRDIDPAVGDDVEFGFVLERASLVFAGNALSPNLHYWFVVSNNRSDSNTILEEGRISYEFNNGALIQIGRLRNPAFLRELDISFARQLSIERSYFNRVFMTGLIEGVVLSKQNDFVRGMAFLSDGRHSGSPSRRKDFFDDNTDFAVTFATDWKLAGEWAQFGDVNSWPDEGEAIFFGASVHYEKGESGDLLPVNEQNHFIAWTTDAAYENAGFTVFAAATGRHQLVPGQAIDQRGAMVQSAYHVCPEKFEIFGRGEYIDFDGFTDVGLGGSAVSDSHVTLLTFGTNLYFNRHASKLTVEATHALDPIPLAASNNGLLVDQPTREGQTVVGTQLQLFF